jgi:hypothetical protein
VAALRAAGATVEVIGLPVDLLVGFRGSWGLLEVKASRSEERRTTPTRQRQREFADRHPNGGPYATVIDVDGALRFLSMMGIEFAA